MMGNINKTFFIYMDDTEDGGFRGSFCNSNDRHNCRFTNLDDMVLQIDCILQESADQNQNEETAECCPAELTLCGHSRYVFLLEVLYMEHSSWQGRLVGTNCPRTCFKSVLDLLKIIMAAKQA